MDCSRWLGVVAGLGFAVFGACGDDGDPSGSDSGTSSPEGCDCMLGAYFPVCGVDGTTYDATCGTQCVPVEVACMSECPCPTTGSTGDSATGSGDGTSTGTGGTGPGGGDPCDDGRVNCEAATPNCSGSTVPEIADDCYTGECIDITECDGIDPFASCEGCSSGTECVSWAECAGDSCTPYGQSCASPDEGSCVGALACDCAGDVLCGALGDHFCFDRSGGGIFCCRGDAETCASAGGG